MNPGPGDPGARSVVTTFRIAARRPGTWRARRSADTVAEMAEPTTPSHTATDAPSDLDRLYAYAVWMLGDRDAALNALRRALRDPAPPGARFKDLLPGVRAEVLTRTHGRRVHGELARARLDEKLRVGTSVSLKMGHPALRGEVRRLHVLLAGFMQSCLIAAVQTLPSAVREVFVLLVVLGMPEREVLEVLDDSPRTLSAHKSRMLAMLEGYLGPRCGHLAKHNPCHCENRLMLALDQDFVELPEHERASETYPHGVFSDLRRMFAAVPPLRLSEAAIASLRPEEPHAAAPA